MRQEDYEIEIFENGEIKVHIKGVKGKRCISHMEFFEKLVGPVKEKHLTHEYYEPDSKVRIDAASEQKVEQAEE